MKEKAGKLGRFNVVDLAAVVLIAAVAVFAVWRLVSDRSDAEQTPVDMTYTCMVEGVPAQFYDSVLPYMGSTIFASGARLDGQIVSVEKGPYYELGPDGEWYEDPAHVDLYFTVTNHTTAGDVLFSKVGEQEVRIGRRDYTLKTEFIEFHNVWILDCQWEGWDW